MLEGTPEGSLITPVTIPYPNSSDNFGGINLTSVFSLSLKTLVESPVV